VGLHLPGQSSSALDERDRRDLSLRALVPRWQALHTSGTSLASTLNFESEASHSLLLTSTSASQGMQAIHMACA